MPFLICANVKGYDRDHHSMWEVRECSFSFLLSRMELAPVSSLAIPVKCNESPNVIMTPVLIVVLEVVVLQSLFWHSSKQPIENMEVSLSNTLAHHPRLLQKVVNDLC